MAFVFYKNTFCYEAASSSCRVVNLKVPNITSTKVKNDLRNKGETSQIQNTSFACEDMARFSTIILQIKPAVVSLPYSKFNKRPTFSTRNTATLIAAARTKTLIRYFPFVAVFKITRQFSSLVVPRPNICLI